MHTGRTRPFHRELSGKITNALDAIKAGRRMVGVMKHLVGDLEELGLSSEEELWSLLPRLLREVNACGPEKCYVGKHPPARSYDQEMRGMELWPFRWPSTTMGKEMFLKFALKRDGNGHWYYFHVDVHENRPKRSDYDLR